MQVHEILGLRAFMRYGPSKIDLRVCVSVSLCVSLCLSVSLCRGSLSLSHSLSPFVSVS